MSVGNGNTRVTEWLMLAKTSRDHPSQTSAQAGTPIAESLATGVLVWCVAVCTCAVFLQFCVFWIHTMKSSAMKIQLPYFKRLVLDYTNRFVL